MQNEPTRRRQTDAAIAATMRYAAERAAENPTKVAKAARVVRAALELGRLTLADITPDRGEAA